jgi:hypothetical protein
VSLLGGIGSPLTSATSRTTRKAFEVAFVLSRLGNVVLMCLYRLSSLSAVELRMYALRERCASTCNQWKYAKTHFLHEREQRVHDLLECERRALQRSSRGSEDISLSD